MAIWQHYKRVLGIFYCACAETAIKQLPVKNLTLPFAPATSISYKTDVFPLPSGVYRIYSMFLCYNVERFCDLGHWPSDLLMPDPHTNFDYSTTIGYWVTITEFDHITVIWNSHCACAVSRDLSPGGMVHILLKSLTPIYLFTVGGVAQWLERRSLTGELSLITPDLRLTCDHFVGKVSAMGQPTRATQPSIPSWSVNE